MKISIITINYNNASGLERTVESIKAQKNKLFEYIVVDGESTDGSVEIINNHSNLINFIISEKDNGIYEAMNKGLRLATGAYCLFLNSGDWLVDENVVDYINYTIDDSCDIYYSDLLVSNCNKRHTIRYPKVLTVDYFLNNTISHQNSLIRTDLLRSVGGYLEQYRIVSDWYFYLHVANSKMGSFKHIDRPIAYYYHEGMSNRVENNQIKEKEHVACIELEFGILAKSILELIMYRSSIYGELSNTYNRPKSLEFVLRGYRYFARRFPCLTKKKSVSYIS